MCVAKVVSVMDALAELKNVVARLRSPEGCPWDQEQTHQSLAPCLVEECAEVLEAIDRDDAELLREELGDVLLSVFMHAQIAAEAGRFELGDVAREIVDKLIRRHPHVFGPDAGETTTGAVLQRWEQIKAAEKAAKGHVNLDPHFKDLPPALPATLYAEDIYKRLRRHGLRSADVDASRVEAIAAELDDETAGARLFELVAACRVAGIDAEGALRRHAGRVRSSSGPA